MKRTLTALALTLTACSPGMFGSGIDTSVTNQTTYRHINAACSNLDLSGPALDTKTFRGLVKCLNSSGALDPLDKLVTKVSDADLGPILSTANRYWLGNSKRLFQVERTYDDLHDKNLLAPFFAEVGRLFENQEFWTSLIVLLREAYYANGSADPNILNLLQSLGHRVTPDRTRAGIGAALSVAGAPAFTSFQARFRGASPGGRTIRSVGDPLLAYLKPTSDPKHVDAGKLLLNKAIDGNLFKTLDQILGGPDQLTGSVPPLTALSGVLMKDNSRLLDGLTSLFHYLHRPISCLDGSKSLPDGDMHVLKATFEHDVSDAGDFYRRENVIQLMTLAPVCQVPPELGQYYPFLTEASNYNTVTELAQLVHVFYGIQAADGSRPMADLLVNVLSDTGSVPPENTLGIKQLIPLVSELSDRGAWDDLWLMAALLKVEDRPDLVSTLQWLLAPDSGLGGKSAFDVVFEAIARESPETFARFISSLGQYVNQDTPVFYPVLSDFRVAYFDNDSHPFVEMLGDLLGDAPTNESFYTALFNVANLPEFPATIGLVAEMGKDGRLTDLAQVVVTLFHRFALQGQSTITGTSVPPFISRAAHNLAKRDLTPFPALTVDVDKYASCSKLDFRIDLSQPTGAQFPAQYEDYAACLDTGDSKPGVKAALELLNTEHTESGKSYYAMLVDQVRGLSFNKADQGYLADTFARTYDDGRVDRLFKIFPFFTSRPVHGADDPAGVIGSVAEPLVDLLGPIISGARANLGELERWLATVIARVDFPALLLHGDQLWHATAQPQPAPLSPPFDVPRIERWIGNKECGLLGGPGSGQVLQAETDRVRNDYLNEATSWDLVPQSDGTLGVRQGWNFDEFKTFLEPLFNRYADPAGSVPSRSVLHSNFAALSYFSLPAGAKPNRWQHYPVQEFQRWLQDHSTDQKLITFYYPKGGLDPDAGYEDTPRVRYVNSLDRLETLIISADFTAPVVNVNEGYRFLEIFGKSWGDEDPSVWPDEIKKEFPDPSHPPPTLKQSADELQKLLKSFASFGGLPKVPDCHQIPDASDPPDVQRAETTDPHGPPIPIGDVLPHHADFQKRLFNLYQVSSVVSDLLPKRRPDGSEDPGMKVLRDLFFELFYSTPEQFRNPNENCDKRYTSGPNKGKFQDNICHNNLWVIMRVARSGLLHQVSRQLWKIAPDNRSLDLFRSFISVNLPAATLPQPGSPVPQGGNLNPELVRVLDTLITKDPDRKLIWNATEQIFDLIDSKDPADKAALKQLTYYALADLEPNGLIEPALTSTAPLLEAHYPYFAAHTDGIGKLLKSQDTARVLEVVYEDTNIPERQRLASVLIDGLNRPELAGDAVSIFEAIDGTPATTQLWNAFSSRLDAVRDLPDYQAIDLSDLTKSVLAFLEEQTTNPTELEVSRKVRAFLGDRLAQGDLDQILLLARKRPDDFYQLLKTVGDSVDNGDLPYLMKVLRGNLSETTD